MYTEGRDAKGQRDYVLRQLLLYSVLTWCWSGVNISWQANRTGMEVKISQEICN